MNAVEELDYRDTVEQIRGSMDDPLWCSVNIQLLAPSISQAVVSFILEHRNAVHAGETVV